MTLAAPSVSETLLRLRGDRAQRPALDWRRAAGLRAEIEDGLFAALGRHQPDLPLVVGARGPAVAAGPTARLRGLLVAQLVRLRAARATLAAPFDDALSAWRAEGSDRDLEAALEALGEEDRARLRAEVEGHDVVVSRALRGLPARWPVRTGQRAGVRLGGGHLVLRDRIDLVIGVGAGARAERVLLDVTSAPLGEATSATLRHHALVDTLRASSPPLAVAALSSATGELRREPVDDRLLGHAVSDLLDLVHRTWGTR